MQHADHAEQEEVLAPDEAPTPMWLPLLGAALLLVAVIFFAATRQGEPAAGGSEAAAAAASGAEPLPEPSGENP
jgi:H+/Cl- antiporter ClcA